MSIYHHSLAPKKTEHSTEWLTFATNSTLEATERREERSRFAEPCSDPITYVPNPPALPNSEQIAARMPTTDEEKTEAIRWYRCHSEHWQTPTTPEELTQAFHAYAEHLAFLDLHPIA